MPVQWDKLESQLTRDEGKRARPYKCTAGKLTIGIGRNIEDVGLSDDEISLMLDNDIANSIADCRLLFADFDDIDDVRSNALVNMAFNLGRARLGQFKRMIAAVNARDWATAAAQAKASAWYMQVGPRAVRICSELETGEFYDA